MASKNRWKIHKGDLVEVIAGNHRGMRGKVLDIDVDRGRATVEGVARVWKHLRPTQQNPQGGRIEREAYIDLSNLMLVSQETGVAQRVRRKAVVVEGPDGKKRTLRYRVGVKDGKPISARDRELAEKAG
ncbi:MAG: 50S ribosomal protein L24 [Planctomycetota bacterium]|nr:MAG: 50S ribosomal protein L24 [Planctomycetota bacterium]